MGTGAHVTSTGAHPQYERCPPAIITGANTYKYSINLFIDILCFRVSGNQMYVHLIGAIGVVEHSF